RVTRHQMYAGDEAVIRAFRAQVEPRLRKDEAIRGREDAGEQINEAIERAQRFLTLASLVTVILSAIAAAMAARRYARRHLDTVALLKTLGATQWVVSGAMLLQLLIVIAVTAAAGLLAGWLAQYGLARIAAEFIGFTLPAASGQPFVLGLLTAATVVIGFAMPHLLQLGTTPPLRVLRRDLPPPRPGSILSYGFAIGALLVLVTAVVGDLLLVGVIAAGLAATAAVA